MRDLQIVFPVPPTEIVDAKIWGKAFLRINAHLQSQYADAVSNIILARRPLDPTDENYLRHVLTHWCGWSPTVSVHRNDSWVQYLQTLFAHIKGLTPILDSLVWPEEVSQYPERLDPSEPTLFLLANDEAYFILVLEELGLYRAGESLREVYEGLQNDRWHGIKEGDWVAEDWNPRYMEWDSRDYFPVYGRLRDNDKRVSLLFNLKKFE
jgi:hypothetical protein